MEDQTLSKDRADTGTLVCSIYCVGRIKFLMFARPTAGTHVFLARAPSHRSRKAHSFTGCRLHIWWLRESMVRNAHLGDFGHGTRGREGTSTKR